jgi:GR25 family glycosyltransferase involved in LPS biosynthesis
MHTVNSFFDKVFVINLDRRPDRLESITRRLDSLGIEFERLQAVDGVDNYHPAISACAKSHYNSIKLSVSRGYNRVLILEDDAYFVDDFLSKFDRLSNDIPDDWDMIYFGALSIRKEYEIDGISKVSYCTCCHAIGINSSVFQDLLDVNDLTRDVDVSYSYIMKTRNVYALDPALIIQESGQSDISGYFYDFPSLFKY